MVGEKDKIFESAIKHSGIFNFREFYIYCHDWLEDEAGLGIMEKKYAEKVVGDAKEIDVEWAGDKNLTDYFRFDVSVKFRIRPIKKVQITRDGKKIDTNEGSIEVKIKGFLVRDYQGKYDSTAFRKFLRGIYEKWIIISRVKEFENKIFGDCDEFLNQAKAFLDLEHRGL